MFGFFRRFFWVFGPNFELFQSFLLVFGQNFWLFNVFSFFASDLNFLNVFSAFCWKFNFFNVFAFYFKFSLLVLLKKKTSLLIKLFHQAPFFGPFS